MNFRFVNTETAVKAACIAAIQRYAGSKTPDYHKAIEHGFQIYRALTDSSPLVQYNPKDKNHDT